MSTHSRQHMMRILPGGGGEDQVRLRVDLREHVHAHPLARDEAMSFSRIHLKRPPNANALAREALRQLPFHLSLRRPASHVRRLPKITAGNEDNFFDRSDCLRGHNVNFSLGIPALPQIDIAFCERPDLTPVERSLLSARIRESNQSRLVEQQTVMDDLMPMNNMTRLPAHGNLSKVRTALAVSLTLLACTLPLKAAPTDWRKLLEQELPLLGHRNWIVIVDSAYPLQSSPGVETIETGASQDEVVRTVLADLSKSKHVAPDVYMDAELPFVPEQGAPGVTVYRAQLPSMLGSLPVQSLPHEQLIKMLPTRGRHSTSWSSRQP